LRFGRVLTGLSILASSTVTAGILSAVTGVYSFPIVSISVASVIAFFGGVIFRSGLRRGS